MAVMFIAWIDVATNTIKQNANSLDRDRTSLKITCHLSLELVPAWLHKAAAASVSRLATLQKQVSPLLRHKQCKPSSTTAM